MIPEGWEEVRLGDFARMRSGGTPHTSVPAYYGGDIPWASISDMSSSRKYLRVTERYLTEEGLNNSAAVLFPPRILLYAMYASIGECCISTCEVSTSQAILGIECGEGLNVEFLFYVMQSRRAEVVRSGQQGTQANLNAQMVREMCVALPAAAEQKAIAEALSDADALVESLDALIAKKRDMKQAAMQQLLSGAVRLGGRTSPWCTRSVSALATITKGVQLGRADMNSMAAVPVWNGGIEPSGFTSAANVRRPVVTVSEGGNSCGWVGRPKGDFWLGGHCYALDPQDSCQSVGFLYHVLKSVEAKIMGLRVGSGLPNIQKTSLAEFSVRVPSEQTEASELTLLFDDLDAEIDALVAQREKAELLKQGMMQELLSGRVRLV